jgi:hypothetical protein
MTISLGAVSAMTKGDGGLPNFDSPEKIAMGAATRYTNFL